MACVGGREAAQRSRPSGASSVSHLFVTCPIAARGQHRLAQALRPCRTEGRVDGADDVEQAHRPARLRLFGLHHLAKQSFSCSLQFFSPKPSTSTVRMLGFCIPDGCGAARRLGRVLGGILPQRLGAGLSEVLVVPLAGERRGQAAGRGHHRHTLRACPLEEMLLPFSTVWAALSTMLPLETDARLASIDGSPHGANRNTSAGASVSAKWARGHRGRSSAFGCRCPAALVGSDEPITPTMHLGLHPIDRAPSRTTGFAPAAASTTMSWRPRPASMLPLLT